jgi:hypothetical protein
VIADRCTAVAVDRADDALAGVRALYAGHGSVLSPPSSPVPADGARGDRADRGQPRAGQRGRGVRVMSLMERGHLRGFRGSSEFRSFFSAVRPYVDRIEEMRHYEVKSAGPR